ncbi:MAG: hypothetical protein HZB39_11950 [Planctomycetes bacterium]|nr:hypothetical protein [Planctomycetota bacterium]
MKISENRRLRGEKKALARHEHQETQNSRFEKRYLEYARAIAEGETSAGKIDFTKLELVLKQAGKTTNDLQAKVAEIRKELAGS